MPEHDFELRLNCSCIGPENAIDDLSVEALDNGEWQPLDIDLNGPGFQIFTYGLLSCQHRYFRLNAAERGLEFASCKAHMTIKTDEDWNINVLYVDFFALLKNGIPTNKDKQYIVERMGLCPVSINMNTISDSHRTITFDNV